MTLELWHLYRKAQVNFLFAKYDICIYKKYIQDICKNYWGHLCKTFAYIKSTYKIYAKIIDDICCTRDLRGYIFAKIIDICTRDLRGYILETSLYAFVCII